VTTEVKKPQLERSRGIHQTDFEGAALALTDPRLRHLTFDRHHLAGLKGTDRARSRAILVPQGQMKEQVLNRYQAQPGQALGEARADPAQGGDG
jgi:hypothetical protein